MRQRKPAISFKNSILFLIPLLITSCGGGGITLDAMDGSKIKFKSENVSCSTGNEYLHFAVDGGRGLARNVTCTSNGVRTFLAGNRTNFSETKQCKVIDSQGKKVNDTYAEMNQNTFTCLAASKLRKIK